MLLQASAETPKDTVMDALREPERQVPGVSFQSLLTEEHNLVYIYIAFYGT